MRGSVELEYNNHTYMKQDTVDNTAEYSYNKSVEYILQVPFSDEAFGTDMERSLNVEIILGEKRKRYLNISAIGSQ